MGYIDRMSSAIRYIEDNIIDKIDFSYVAKLACCPSHQFQRVFSFVADMSMSDYIKRRRLTLAAIELQENNTKKIIDVALKYGYNSHSAFTRAFKEHHGIPPNAARCKNAQLNIFPCMSLSFSPKSNEKFNYRIEKGEIKMAKLVKVEFEDFGPYKIVGKQIKTTALSRDISALWGKCFTDGTYDKLVQMKEYIPKNIKDDYVGYIRELNPTKKTFVYLVGMFMKPETPVPVGFSSYMISKCTVAKTWIEGEEYDIYSNANQLTLSAIMDNGYAPDISDYFVCEIYTDERFGEPKNKGEKVLILDYLVPCRKK